MFEISIFKNESVFKEGFFEKGMPAPQLVKYDASTYVFNKHGTGHQRGELYLCNNRVIGTLSDGEAQEVFLGIRMLNKLNDDLAYITLRKAKPDIQDTEGTIVVIHIAALRAPGARGTPSTLAPGYIGLHAYNSEFADSTLLNKIYQTTNSFQSIANLAKITPNEIDQLLKKKRAPFDGIKKNALENIACANGQTIALLLEQKK